MFCEKNIIEGLVFEDDMHTVVENAFFSNLTSYTRADAHITLFIIVIIRESDGAPMAIGNPI